MLADTTGVVGTVASIVGIVVGVLSTIAVYRLQSRPKQLDYEFISGVRLLAAEAARLEGGLKVQYGERKVTDPYLLLVRLINTGNKSIDAHDFDQPVRVELGASTEVVTAGIVKKSNSEMQPDRPEVGDGGVVRIHPLLYKAGEFIAFTILTDGEPTERKVIARISGGGEPRPFKQSTERTPFQQAAAIIPAVLLGILGFNLENIVGARLFPEWGAPQGAHVPASLYVFVLVSVIVILGVSMLAYNIVIRRIDSARKRRITDLDVVS